MKQGNNLESLKAFLLENPTHKVYDYSQERSWDMCHRKYAYRYVQGYAEDIGPAATLSTVLIHPMVANFYIMDWPAFPNVYDDIDLWRLKIADFKSSLNDVAMPRNFDSNFNAVNLAKASQLLTDQAPQIKDPFTYNNTEQVYWKVLPDIDHAVWIAKIDVVLNDTWNGCVLPVEVKASQYAYNKDVSYMDRQLLGQMWTSEAKQQIRLFFQFGASKLGRHGDIETSNVTLTVNKFPIDHSLLEEWLEERQLKVEQIQHAVKKNIFPKMAPDACHAFNKPCQYLHVCPLAGVRGIALFEAAKSNPFEYLGLEG